MPNNNQNNGSAEPETTANVPLDIPVTTPETTKTADVASTTASGATNATPSVYPRLPTDPTTSDSVPTVIPVSVK